MTETTLIANPPVAVARGVAERLLHLPDLAVVDIVVATIVGNGISGDPLWVLTVSPPSNGKTELLAAAAAIPQTQLLSTLTKNTLISGARVRCGDDGQEVEPSLLVRLKKHTLIIKDFTTILGLQRDERNQILGLLREVYDGKVVKVFGTGKTFVWEGKMGLLGAVTPVIDRHGALTSILGERFLLYRIPGGDRDSRRAQAALALAASGHETRLRAELGSAMKTAAQDAGAWAKAHGAEVRLPTAFVDTLITLADLAAYGRAGVLRDGYDREVRYLPESEGPSRLAKQLRQLTGALLAVRGKCQPDEEELRVLRKVARDTMQPLRARTLAALAEKGPMQTADVAKAMGVPYAMSQRALDDCQLLGLVRKREDVYELLLSRLADIQSSGIFHGYEYRNVPPEGEREREEE